VGEPDDIGGVVAFLCSEDARWIRWSAHRGIWWDQFMIYDLKLKMSCFYSNHKS
jgi:hypothetical protein